MRLLHFPVAPDGGAETRLEEALGRTAEVAMEAGDAATVALELEGADDGSTAGGELAFVPPDTNDATEGEGSVKEWKLSQISGHLTLS